jgi:capsular polysaccharide biosynthesis protein
MYHSTIGHLLAALIHDGLHESKIVNCFSPLTWVWTRKLIAQIFPRDKVDYGLVPDKRCFIKNAILYDIPPLSLLNDPLHREKVLCAVSRLRNAAIALSQRANIINHPKRIFISRHSSAARSPSNLTDLEFLMKEFDFQILYFEHISPEEQLCYFHHAEIIAGLHGAALTNIIAARTNATLLEFSLTYEKRRCYENLAKKILCINYLESSCISKVRQDGKEIHLINLEVAQESLLQAIAQSCR